jgi:outer membrane protein assembly factor BamE (lipoprotein component of BamABCDE complex)
MRYASLILLILLVFTFSCGQSVVQGRKIDTAKVSALIKGETTTDEVVQTLGKPDKIEKMESGDEKYFYAYHEEKYIRWNVLPEETNQNLEITIKDGKVKDYQYQRASTLPIED